MNEIKKDLVVIGGGPAGMICAIRAAECGKSVLILDGNRQLGRKLRITGKGRCNLTNACDVRTVMQNIPGDGRFLYSSLSRFGPQETFAYFSELGVPLKIERGNRVFPQSDRADDIANALVQRLSVLGVQTIRTRATRILSQGGVVCGVEYEDGTAACSAVALCTGGRSYPLTGSDGAGYVMARSLGHTIVSTRPSLVPLESPDDYCAEMQGFSLRNVVLRAYEDNSLIFRDFGEMMFTHFGVSGPLVLSASAHMRHMGAACYRLEIDLKPALEENRLDDRIVRDFEKYSNREFKNSLNDLLPHSMIPVILKLSGIPDDLKVHSVTKEQRRRLIHLLKAFPVSVSGFRPIDEAIITAGGISTKEINPRTMESRIVHGLYFAGEILDLDAYTGGFNLQIAWSTGHVAGCAIGAEP